MTTAITSATAAAHLRSPATLVFEQAQALNRHLQQCHAARGRLFQAAAWAELAHGLLAPRFVTTVSVAALLLLVCSW